MCPSKKTTTLIPGVMHSHTRMALVVRRYFRFYTLHATYIIYHVLPVLVKAFTKYVYALQPYQGNTVVGLPSVK